MAKKKLSRFKELENLDRVLQPLFEEVFEKDYLLKGKWSRELFGNDHPLVLELGCGKGEYTVGLARRSPEKNFIGLDIKGARMWTGAKIAQIEKLDNVGFLRTRIDFAPSFFAPGEVEEIWITFPDPQEKKKKKKKRLPGAQFLNRYRNFLIDGGLVHLKTDNRNLYLDTLELVKFNGLEIIRHSDDIYSTDWKDVITGIRTYYEKRFLSEGKQINYICFSLPSGKEILPLPDESE